MSSGLLTNARVFVVNTGMPASTAFSIAGTMPAESTGAMQMASTSFSMASKTALYCSSAFWVSSGEFSVTLTPISSPVAMAAAAR